MTKLLEQALDVVRAMPPADQDTIAEAILAMSHIGAPAAIPRGHLRDVVEGLADIERGDIATDEEVAEAFRSFDR